MEEGSMETASEVRRRNLKTGVVLGSVAVAVFFGFMLRYWLVKG